MRRRSSGGTGTASLEPEDNQGIDLSKVEIPEGEVAMYNNLQRKEGEKEKVEFFNKKKFLDPNFFLIQSFLA